MQDDEFEWDDDKARINLADHKIDFEDARLVFDDPGFVDDDDDTMTTVRTATVPSGWSRDS